LQVHLDAISGDPRISSIDTDSSPTRATYAGGPRSTSVTSISRARSSPHSFE
jgi:hypothetical protein